MKSFNKPMQVDSKNYSDFEYFYLFYDKKTGKQILRKPMSFKKAQLKALEMEKLGIIMKQEIC